MLTRPQRRRRSRALVLTMALAVIGAACSNSGEQKSTVSSAPGTTDSTTAPTSGSTDATVDLGQHVPLPGVPGVTDTEIRFSAVGIRSNNPLGTCVLDCFMDGVNAYLGWRNSQGGIWGRTLVVSKTIDDELGNNQVRSLDIISANDTFATFSAPMVATGWPDLATAGIPTYTLANNPTNGAPGIFGNQPAHCYDCTTRTVAYLAKLAGATKIASLGYGVSENSKLCAKGNRDSIEKYSADIGGAKVVYFNDNLAFGLPNGVGPEVTAMKDAGVDLVLTCLDLNGMKTIAQELKRQGVRDTIKMVHANTYDQEFVKNSGGLFDGDFIGVSFRPFEADAGNSELATFHEWMAKSSKTETENAMLGWINADLAYEGLKAAGPNFDRKKVIEATNQLTAFTAGGLVPFIDWSRQHVAPTEADPATHGSQKDCMAFVTVKAGAFVPVGDPKNPWVCWPGDTRDWSEPVATNF